MLLCSSSCCWKRVVRDRGRGWSGKVGVDFPGDVALQAADDLAFAQAFGGAPLDVVAGRLVATHPDDRDDVEGTVCGAVAAAAEPVSAAGASAAGRLGRDAAELGEGGFVADAFGVVARGDEELASDLDADTVQFDQFGCRRVDQGVDLLVASPYRPEDLVAWAS